MKAFVGGRENQSRLTVVYDYLTELWRCCSTNRDGSVNCSTHETFDAPPPKNLSVLYPTSASNLGKQTLPVSWTPDNTGSVVIVPTGSDLTSTCPSSTLPTDVHSTPTHSALPTDTEVTHSIPDATSTPRSTTAPDSDRETPDGSGMRQGAVAGISVGAVVGLGLAAAVVYWLLRLRRRPDPGTISMLDTNVSRSNSVSVANGRERQSSDSGGTTTTMPPERDPNNISGGVDRLPRRERGGGSGGEGEHIQRS